MISLNFWKNITNADLNSLWEDAKNNSTVDSLRRHITIIVLTILLVTTMISLFISRKHIFEHCALFFSIVSAMVVYYQFRLQSTFTKLQPFTSSISTAKCISKCVKLIDESPGQINIHDIESDDELYAWVTFVLGLCDDIANAVRVNIISDKVVCYTQGPFIMKIYRGFRPYIKQLAEEGKGSYRGLEFLEWKWRNNKHVNRFEKEV